MACRCPAGIYQVEVDVLARANLFAIAPDTLQLSKARDYYPDMGAVIIVKDPAPTD